MRFKVAQRAITRDVCLNSGSVGRPAGLVPLACLWGALLFCAGPAAAAPAQAPLGAGIQAYRAGDFKTALVLFLEAREQGPVSDTLLFNLGLTYYRLEDYPAARRTFLDLRQRPAMAGVAEYHLGLVAAQLGQMNRATRHLRAAAAGDSVPLRQLARTALARLTDRPAARAPAAYASLGIGFDSNRNQIAEEIQITGPEPESAYAEFAGVVQYPLPKLTDTDLRATVFRRDYETDDALDQTVGQLSLRRTWRPGSWRVMLAAESDAAFLEGDSLQNTYGLNLEAVRRHGPSTLTLRYRPSAVDGGADYEYLDGERHRLEVAEAFLLGEFQIRAGYEAELNDRSDWQVGEQFSSQSPLRHGPLLRVSRTLTPDLTLDVNAGFRHSRYRDVNRYVQDGTLRSERRVEDLAYLGGALRLRLGRAWGLRLDYRYTDNDSSLDTYEYTRHLATLALEWRY